MKSKPSDLSKELLAWYQENKRNLPWRKNKNPYYIWISESMLQQTTVTAVLPFFERFIQRFPNIESLAKAPLTDVLEMWAGLGYYSRARNLHKAAQSLSQNGFARTFEGLLELPGFGPYTSRAVASIAFGQAVGVLDGNVIRILSRVTGYNKPWWNSEGRNHLQELSDKIAQTGDPSELNQAMMELGATICTPQKTMCLLCPWKKFCVALKENQVAQLPLKKPKRENEIWYWRPYFVKKSDQILLSQNKYAPFLKNEFIFPGEIQKLESKPKSYSLKHAITHHSIFIDILTKNPQDLSLSKIEKLCGPLRWVSVKELKSISPFSLVHKVVHETQKAKSPKAKTQDLTGQGAVKKLNQRLKTKTSKVRKKIELSEGKNR